MVGVSQKGELVFEQGQAVRVLGDLPGSTGMKISRLLSPDEMVQLTKAHDNREFGLAQEKLPSRGPGDYWLFSGDFALDGQPYLYIPEQLSGIDLIALYHTHPNGIAIPSESDIAELEWRHSIGIQDKSGIIPVEDKPARVILYFPFTQPSDYAPEGKHYQPRQP
jgi:hypothetical protein